MEQTTGGGVTERRKIREIVRAISDAYNTVYNSELMVKEIKHTKNNKKFRESISLEENINRKEVISSEK